ncbi:MAG: AAA family ATPase, partial [Firmicutes bacterium]|nr:AAA family ATPase [Bacillota bacterium]
MYLKRIEIVGFKSFADRTEIEVAPGVTAVVGPNGSGKSNIADAVRFVLGEQSARSLRGARMEEVIFAGSDARKGVNVCEVSLTLDNADGGLRSEFAEVTVTRRLYRSGESEYCLCGSPCRLRDIAELFMDTGVGREAYSIIGQGKIDEILSTRAEDRRGVFEEAAGIITGKVRRKDAQRRLGDADQNIERLGDLLHELERQLQPLAARAERARAYRDARARRDALQIGLLAHDIASLRDHRAAGQVELQRVQAQEADIVAEQDALRERVTALREQSALADRKLAAAQNELVTATARAERCEADRRVTDERWRAARERCADQQARIEELEARLGATEAEAAVLRERRREAREQARRLEQELAQVTGEERSAVTAAEQALAVARSELIERMREQASRRSVLQALQAEREQAQRSHERAVREVRECEQREIELRADIERAGSAHREAQKAVDDHEHHAQRARALHDALTGELAAANRTLDEARRELSAVTARKTAFEELERAREGFASGPKAVLAAAAAGRLKGVHGAVADLIQVESARALAIETALGGGLQNIVVDKEEHARAAIAELRRRNLGRATFLPLATVRGRRVPLHELQLVSGSEGFVGLAADLVTCVDDV